MITGSVGLATLLQFSLLGAPSNAPFVFYYLSVAATAWACGPCGGGLTVLASAAAANYLFLSKPDSWALGPRDVCSTLTFAISSSAIAWLCGHGRRAVDAARRATFELQNRERALQQSEENYRTLLEMAGNGIVVAVVETRQLVYGNRALRDMFGYAEREIRDLTLDDLHPAENHDRLHDTLETGLSPTPRHLPEIPCVRNDGNPFWADVSITALTFDGQYCVLGIFQDITSRKTMELRLRSEQIQREKVELELRHAQKLEAIGRLAAGIAHEINTPTQFINDSLQFIRSGLEDLSQLHDSYKDAIAALGVAAQDSGPESRLREMEEAVDARYLEENIPKSVARCFEGVERIVGIVRAMKDFAHPDAREKSPADINQAIRNTLTICRNEYKYVAELEADLGELPPVMCHLGDLNQVFVNLLVNASHAIASAADGDGYKGRIVIRTACEGERVTITFQDNGCGVPESIRDRVFEPFFTTKEVGKGTGQGLAIARSIVVDKHGGSLTFSSTPGHGTTFIVTLPVDGGASREVRPWAATSGTHPQAAPVSSHHRESV